VTPEGDLFNPGCVCGHDYDDHGPYDEGEKCRFRKDCKCKRFECLSGKVDGVSKYGDGCTWCEP
jgi:hypothetical protein